jgi:5-hydroxyisourate hydrolase
MPGISVHAVDVATGRPATGLRVEVFAVEPERRLLAEGRLGADGALDHPITAARLGAGAYEVVFHLAEHAGAAPFLDEVPFRFRVTDPDEHYHLPLKYTPWGISLFRGA